MRVTLSKFMNRFKPMDNTSKDPSAPCGYDEAHGIDRKKLNDSLIAATLAQRGSRYGDFNDNANLSQYLEHCIHRQPGYDNLSNLHREALKFIFQKISRIVNGDPNYADNWHDIQGYAKLVEDRLSKETK